MYHIFFIHLSDNGHLGCFHILATVNSAAMNTGVYVSFQISVLFSFHKYPELKLMSHMAVVFLILRGDSILFFISAAPINNPNSA